MSSNHIELSTRAVKDLKKLQRSGSYQKVLDLLKSELSKEPTPENLDIKPLQGHPGWLRLRTGDYRVLYRPLTEPELKQLTNPTPTKTGAKGFFVERVVHRKDLHTAAEKLGLVAHEETVLKIRHKS